MSFKKNTTSAPVAVAQQSRSTDDIVSELLDVKSRAKSIDLEEKRLRAELGSIKPVDGGWIHSTLKIGFRQVEYERSPGFDFERFKDDEPDLYARIVVEQIVPELDEDAVADHMTTDDSILAKLQKYLIPGTKVKKLVQVKEDEA